MHELPDTQLHSAHTAAAHTAAAHSEGAVPTAKTGTFCNAMHTLTHNHDELLIPVVYGSILLLLCVPPWLVLDPSRPERAGGVHANLGLFKATLAHFYLQANTYGVS